MKLTLIGVLCAFFFSTQFGMKKEKKPLIPRKTPPRLCIMKPFYPQQIRDQSKKYDPEEPSIRAFYKTKETKHFFPESVAMSIMIDEGSKEHIWEFYNPPLTTKFISLALSGDASLITCLFEYENRLALIWNKNRTSQWQETTFSKEKSEINPSQCILAPSWTGKIICVACNITLKKPIFKIIPTEKYHSRKMVVNTSIESDYHRKMRLYGWQPHIKWIGDSTLLLSLREKVVEYRISEIEDEDSD